MKQILAIAIILLASQVALANDVDDSILEELSSISEMQVSMKTKEGVSNTQASVVAEYDDGLVVTLKSVR